jgi:hypothetical protein
VSNPSTTEPQVWDFTLPLRLPTFNQMLRMHFGARKRLLNNVAWHIVASGARPPRTPLQRCRIIIERSSSQEPDPDGMTSCAKALLDVLQPPSKRHPLGLGYIAEDSSKCIESLEVRHITQPQLRTRVIIKEVL